LPPGFLPLLIDGIGKLGMMAESMGRAELMGTMVAAELMGMAIVWGKGVEEGISTA
jgi:hypothetical protein